MSLIKLKAVEYVIISFSAGADKLKSGTISINEITI
jgi:hypothetical protein